jgi:hypothetical protein
MPIMGTPPRGGPPPPEEGGLPAGGRLAVGGGAEAPDDGEPPPDEEPAAGAPSVVEDFRRPANKLNAYFFRFPERPDEDEEADGAAPTDGGAVGEAFDNTELLKGSYSAGGSGCFPVEEAVRKFYSTAEMQHNTR